VSDFEFLLVGVSMILAAALVRSIEGAYPLWRSPGRSWLAALFVYHTLAHAITYFVTLLDNLQAEASVALVVISMTMASLHFLRSHIIATAQPAGIDD